MEMESSRRPSFDRSRELGLKRPRLAEEPSLNNRAFQQKQQRPANSGAVVSASSRFRLSNDRDRDSDESVRGPYQQPTQLQQHQELVNQYKAALAELTFNSKPIITNLTIIAGENTHAAKSIAATICANILEVPSDQKLPSLYLLDSIVKNIGKDYIKYFAAKLPEVFCKAFRQVDPSVHSSMQHLFGTWKGVFPPQSLQIIERELGFVAAANGSSSTSTTSRADSQTQRQPHSIHVNPKYLEARRLQQSSRNVHHPQREELRDSVHEKPPLGAELEDHEYSSGLSRNITSRLGKPSERIIDHSYDKQWSSAARGVEESISNQRNGVNARQNTPSILASRSANMHLLPPHQVANRELTRSWKNSEEEEYMWDDLNPGVADHLAVDNIQKDHWSVDGLDIGSRIDRETDSLSSDQVSFGRPRTSSWKFQEQPLVPGLDIPNPRTGFHSHVGSAHAGASSFALPPIAAPGPAGPIGQRHPSSGKSLISQHASRDPRLNLVEKEQAQANSLAQPNRKPALLSRSSDMGPHNPKLHDSFLGVHQNLHLDNIKKSDTQSFQKTTSSMPSFLSKQYNPAAQGKQLPLGQLEAEPSSGFPNRVKPLGSPSGTSNALAGDSAGQLNTSALLAAVLKSVPLGPLTDGGQPSLPIGTSQSSLPGPKSKSSSSSGSAHDLMSLLSKKRTDALPLSSRLPPPSSSLTGTATSDGPSSSSNSLSSLISTLMAKGLIVASTTESEAPGSPSLSSKSIHNQNSDAATSTEVPSVPVSSAIPSSTADKLTSPKPSQAAAQTIKTEVENIMGFEFRLDFLRQFHPSVVDGLFQDLPHSCSICGLRLKLEERLERHLEWHALKQAGPIKSSRRWYASPEDWVAGKAASNFGSSIVESSQESSKALEKDPEPMVPADESHCVCLLCGELFEDFYSLERDEWMFKGAVYMTISSESGIRGSSSQTNGQGIIVHAKCMADDSVHDLEQVNFAKMETGV